MMASLAESYKNPNSLISHYTDTYPYVSPTKFASSLKDKVVLITGAGRGIGRATALAFAAAGAHVACMARTRTDVEAVVHEISDKRHPRALAIVGDVTDPTAPARVVQEIEELLGPIDVLINNAGISRVSDIEHERDMSKAFHVINVSVQGTMAFIHAALPAMISRKSGVIINIVSVLATINLPYFSAYSCAKSGLIRATEIMDMEFRPQNIYSYAVAPGMIPDTNIGQGALNEECYEKVDNMKHFMNNFGPSMTDALALPADTMVALVADEGAKHMSGRYIDVTQDLEAVLEDAKKGPESRIERERLYTLKVDTL